ncbi:MAG: hypothetical protein KDD48_06455, partial [Bdellovibrionales bacterium]|nr:hypothetical protein [Bdellovibrionales bacterium]
AFKFEDCKLVKDGKVTGEKCKVKEHMPQGMDTTGHWVFKVEGKTMKTSVLYKYPSGNVRHLEEVLAKK